MTKEEKARNNWKDMHRLFGPKSPEELRAYQDYISIRQGGGKKPPRSKVKAATWPARQLFETESLWRAA